MPPIETFERNHDALLWPLVSYNDYGRVTISSDVVELKVRWEQKRSERLDAQGHRISLDAMVIVDRQIEIGGEMVRRTLEDWVGTGSGGGQAEIYKVVWYDEVADVRGREVLREVGLKRLKGSLGDRV